MTDKEAMKLVKILENIEDYRITMTAAHEIRRLHFENKELKEALAQRTWVGLTDDEFEHIEFGCRSTPFGKIEAMQQVEVKLREKNFD
jgi:hypothetical protein